MLVRNKDQRSQDYKGGMTQAYRPSHADATYDAKYGVRAVAGGGRSGARETIGRVAGGAVAREVLRLYAGVEVVGYVSKVQDVGMPDDFDVARSAIGGVGVHGRCPHESASA
ncbi:chorismate synthase [Aureococcus anophagefferens]|nr:chorismate synthase [Aureococcus anophagefferens]